MISFKDALGQSSNVIALCDSDLDGTGCSTLIHHLNDYWYKEPYIKIVQTNSGGQVDDDIPWKHINPRGNNLIIIADLCPTRPVFEKLLKDNHVFLFDHHETTRNDLEGLDGFHYEYDLERCSCKLLYDFLTAALPDYPNGEALQQFVNNVNTYDLYRKTDPNWEEAWDTCQIVWKYTRRDYMRGLNSFTRTAVARTRLHKSKFIFSEPEKQYLKKEREVLEKMWADTTNSLHLREDSKGFKYAYFETSRKVSELASRVLGKYDVSYVVVHNKYLKDKNKVSMRSSGFNVKEIAERYGGGGHVKAASMFLTGDYEELFKQLRKGESHLQ